MLPYINLRTSSEPSSVDIDRILTSLAFISLSEATGASVDERTSLTPIKVEPRTQPNPNVIQSNL